MASFNYFIILPLFIILYLDHIIKSETRPVFSSDSQYVIHGLQDSTISIWSTTTAKHIVNLTGHVGQPKCIAFNPKKAFFASGMFIHHLKCM